MARLQILGRKVEIVASDSIVIKGAREHNLKNVDVTIPRDKLVVITGLSTPSTPRASAAMWKAFPPMPVNSWGK